MADKGWTARVAAAAGVAAGTGAAQLGLGYGLGVVVWPAVPADDSVWLGSLGWATWIAASATVFGAVIAGRLGRGTGGPWRFALAASAAVGALLTVALIALPARAAVRTDTFSPQTIAGGYAVIGVLLGLVIAYWAVVSRPVAANLIATAAWLWSLAVAAVVATIFWQRPSATYLSSWQFFSPDSPDQQYGTISWPSAVLTLLAALVVGVIGVLPAVRRGDLGVGAASSGAVGPLLVAAAFFVLAPQLTGTPGPLQSAYLIAPYAVLAGLAGSAMTVALGQRRAAGRANGSASGASDASFAGFSSSNSHDGGAVSAGAGSGGAVSAGAGSAGAAAAGSRAGNSESSRSQGAARPRDAGAASVGSGSVAAVPSPRPASKGQDRAESGPSSTPPPVDAGPAHSASEPDTEPGPRRSFMDRFRRGRATQRDAESTVDASAIATGRAKAPASATASAPAAVAAQAQAAPYAAASGRGRSRPAGSPRSGVPSVDGNARPASSSTPGRSDSRSTVAAPPASPPIAKINEAQSGEKLAPQPRSTTASDPDSPSGPTNTASSDKTPPASKTPAKSTKATPARASAQPSAPRQTRSAVGKASTPAKPATPKDAAAKEAGPRRTAPQASGPNVAGPNVAGPNVAGPSAAAPNAAGLNRAEPRETPPRQGGAKGAGPRDAGPWTDDADTAELPVQDTRRRPGRRIGENQTD